MELSRRQTVNSVQLFERDDVAIYNSIPTVEGYHHDGHSTYGFYYSWIKYCRSWFRTSWDECGETFHALGAKVKVGARKSEHIAQNYRNGFNTLSF